MRKILFYIPQNLVMKDIRFSPMVYSEFGISIDKSNPISRKLFESYSFNTSWFSFVDNVEQADFIFMPNKYTQLIRIYPKVVEEYKKMSVKTGVPIFTDATSDFDHGITEDYIYTMRIGGYSFKERAQDIYIPPHADDVLERECEGNLVLRDKTETPSVGFAGWAHLSFKQKLRTFVKEAPIRIKGIFDKKYRAMQKGVLWRAKVMRVLQSVYGIETNFLVRTSFSSHTGTAEKDISVLRKEFVDNLLNNDYALCVRGDANASVRLFEALSVGRIPLILNTEQILPLGDVIDYDSFSLVVDHSEISDLPQILKDFHKNISPEEFKEMQMKARDAYKNHMRLDALHTYIHQKLLGFIEKEN